MRVAKSKQARELFNFCEPSGHFINFESPHDLSGGIQTFTTYQYQSKSKNLAKGLLYGPSIMS
jgi:hypothetical protein